MEAVLEGFAGSLEAEDLSPRTVINYVNDMRLFGRWYEESYSQPFEPGRIVQREVSEYRAWLQGSAQGRKPAAAETVNRRLVSLRRFFGWVSPERNPAAGVKGIKIIDPGVQALSLPQLRRLLREVHAGGRVRDIAILELLAGTGIRVGELVQSRLDDVEISERRGTIRVRNGKGRSSREIELNVDVRRALSAWMDSRQRPGSDWLFLGERGHLTACGVWLIVRKYGDRAGISKLHVHQLRHTVATRLLRELHLDLATVARIMGHRSIQTTLRYAEPNREDMAAAMEGLSLTGE